MEENPARGRNEADHVRDQWLAAVRAYADTPDPENRARILREAIAGLIAQDADPARVRLREWVMGTLPDDAGMRADYARFQELLPLILAGAASLSYADIAWFMHHLEECEPSFDEYMELREALDAEHAALQSLYGDGPAPLRAPEHLIDQADAG